MDQATLELLRDIVRMVQRLLYQIGGHLDIMEETIREEREGERIVIFTQD